MPDKPTLEKTICLLFNSTALWLALLFLIMQPVLGYLDPLRYLPYNRVHPFQQIQRCTGYKFKLLMSREKAADILLIGSSVFMCPIYYTDATFDKNSFAALKATTDKLDLNPLQSYSHALYLAQQLSQVEGKPIDIFNMTMPAAMVSDQELILSRVLARRQKPGTIVYAIFPRDFVDNLIPPVGSTPVFKSIGNLGDAIAFRKDLSPDTIQDLIAFSLCSYYRVRNDFQSLIVDRVSHFLNHPRTLAEAMQAESSGSASPAVTKNESPVNKPASSSGDKGNQPATSITAVEEFDKQVEDYRHRYNPVNKARFAQELSSFARILSMCKQHGVRLMVLNMPLTGAARAVIPDALYARYLQQVSLLCQNNAVPFLDLEAPGTFKNSDFIDSVHLKSDGGKKFQDILIEMFTRTQCTIKGRSSKT